MSIVPVNAPDPTLVAIGDINITSHWLATPSGTKPLKGTQIFVTDLTRTETRTPGWAIAFAIILAIFTFLLGLLLLLVKESKTVGTVQVTVQNDGLLYATQIPAHSPQTLWDVQNRVNYARNVIASAA